MGAERDREPVVQSGTLDRQDRVVDRVARRRVTEAESRPVVDGAGRRRLHRFRGRGPKASGRARPRRRAAGGRRPPPVAATRSRGDEQRRAALDPQHDHIAQRGRKRGGAGRRELLRRRTGCLRCGGARHRAATSRVGARGCPAINDRRRVAVEPGELEARHAHGGARVRRACERSIVASTSSLAKRADEQERRLSPRLRVEEVDDLDAGRVGPVEIFEHDHDPRTFGQHVRQAEQCFEQVRLAISASGAPVTGRRPRRVERPGPARAGPRIGPPSLVEPARSRRTPTTGPYGRPPPSAGVHMPDGTMPPARARSRNSSIRRVLPMPASPPTKTGPGTVGVDPGQHPDERVELSTPAWGTSSSANPRSRDGLAHRGGPTVRRRPALLHLGDRIRDQAVRLPVHGVRGSVVRRLDEAEHLAGALVEPVAQVADAPPPPAPPGRGRGRGPPCPVVSPSTFS